MSSLCKEEREEVTIPEISQLSQRFAHAIKDLEHGEIIEIIVSMPPKESEVLDLFVNNKKPLNALLTLMGGNISLANSYISRFEDLIYMKKGWFPFQKDIKTPSETEWFLLRFCKKRDIKHSTTLTPNHIADIMTHRKISESLKERTLGFLFEIGSDDVKAFIALTKPEIVLKKVA